MSLGPSNMAPDVGHPNISKMLLAIRNNPKKLKDQAENKPQVEPIIKQQVPIIIPQVKPVPTKGVNPLQIALDKKFGKALPKDKDDKDSDDDWNPDRKYLKYKSKYLRLKKQSLQI